MPIQKAEETTHPDIYRGQSRIWGQGHLYSSKCVVVPSSLAKIMNIEDGDTLVFKEDGTNGHVYIEVVHEEKRSKKK